MNFQKLLPSLDERAMVIGMTGSGKTTLARYLLETRPYVVVYDTKGQIRWPGYQTINNFEFLRQAEHTHLHYLPSLQDSLNTESIDKFLHWVYQRGNTTLYIDEISYTCIDGRIPFWLHGIVARGRELGVSFIGSTQRPKRIPLALLSEAEKWYIFRLNLREDAKRVEETFGIQEEDIQSLPKHHFYFGSIDYVHHKPLKLSLR